LHTKKKLKNCANIFKIITKTRDSYVIREKLLLYSSFSGLRTTEFFSTLLFFHFFFSQERVSLVIDLKKPTEKKLFASFKLALSFAISLAAESSYF